jgi:hypothetical protein
MTLYYKLHQRGHLWHYIKLLDDRNPKAVEVVNFLNPTPQVYFSEFDLADPGSIVEYQAMKSATRIEAWEYEQAYELATREAFEVYINGKKQ